MQKVLKKGQIYWAELGQNEDSVQSGRRPVCIYANRPSLTYSSIATVIPCTSRMDKLKAIPTQFLLEEHVMGRPCILLPEQIQTISKEQLMGDPIYSLEEAELKALDRAVMRQLAIAWFR